MGRNLLELEFHGGDTGFVNESAITGGGNVRFGFGESSEKGRFKKDRLRHEEVLCKLQDACCVGNDLHGLDARDIVKEPSAAGVHELGVALHFH